MTNTPVGCPAGGTFLIQDTNPAAVFIPEEFSPEDRLIGRTAADFLTQEVMPHVARIESQKAAG